MKNSYFESKTSIAFEKLWGVFCLGVSVVIICFVTQEGLELNDHKLLIACLYFASSGIRGMHNQGWFLLLLL